MAKRKFRHRPFRKLLLLLLLIGIFFYWNNAALQTECFFFSSDDLPAGFDGCRIVQLSDLHGKTFGRGNRHLLDAVAAAAPDYIFFTGDLADEDTDLPPAYAAALADDLAAIAPVFYVTGNHEWACGTDTAENIKSVLRDAGVTVLTNEALPLERNGDTIVLAGIDDPNGYADQKTPEQLAVEIFSAYGDPFWILLAHRNDQFASRYSLLGADLVFSGHGHGGVIRLPFTDGLAGTQHNLFPSYTAGLYEGNGSCLFVSRGLGNVGLTFRLFNRPQVAVITLQKG